MQSLTTLIVLPLLGAVIIAVLPAQRLLWVRAVALVTSALALILALSLLSITDLTTLTEHVKWNPRMGMAYIVGIDGFSLPMVILATLLCLVAIVASAGITERAKGYYLLMLLLEAAILGVFMVQDWLLFYIFWELTLIPLFFLIDRWGGHNRHGAALNFVLYTLGGSVFLLVAMLVLYDNIPVRSFEMKVMTQGARLLSGQKQLWIFLGFFIAFGVKMAIFPIHGWLPLAHVEAPSPVSILLSGILLKMGSYGLLRVTEMLPVAAMNMQGWLLGLALISMVYGGLLAWRQSDLKAMIAYSSISHMGVVLLGIATLNSTGLTGAVMQMTAHGLVAGVLFLLIGLLYERTHTRDVRQYSSLVRTTPRFAFFTILAFIAAVSMPGTAGFVAELHVLLGGFVLWGWAVLALSIGVLISAAYAIRTVVYLFTGPVHEEMRHVRDLGKTEMVPAIVLTASIVLLGMFPAAFLNMINPAVTQLSKLFME
ncbi:MAG: NADH-quinone oxidoreductase subunit M [Planctomycetes bacterium]|nr:NADH-quinone oxidoreductase subunit M [Planctomycetota bacterium]